MATERGDARSKRAQARGDRRAKASQKQQGQGQRQQRQREEEPRAEQSSEGGSGLTTPRLVAAGAAAGALLGTAKAVLDRRHEHDVADRSDDYDDDYEEQEEPEPRRAREGREQQSDHPGGVRGLLVSVLEAALEAVQEPGQSRHGRDEADDEGMQEEEDDDEEAEQEPRGEHHDDGRPTARGDEDEAGREAVESEEEAGDPGADQEPEDELTPHARSDDEDDDDDIDEADEADDAPEDRVGERDLGDDAEAIVASHNGDGPATGILARAREQITMLVGREPESASRVEHVDGGWRLAFEVVEVPRIPPTTDVMASYSVALDEDGNVLEYGRTQRYYRNRAEGEGLE
jgi:hypothetical protein